MIPPETVALVKERTDIVALIGESIRLQRRGRSYVGLCPFHKEKSPSFYVHPDRRFYHCFGCAESGSAVDFVMKTSGLDFREAVTLLAERSGVAIEEVSGHEARKGKSERDEVFAATALAATFFEQRLALGTTREARGRHPAARHAMAELHKRGMPDLASGTADARRWLDTLQAFRVGYAPPGWDGLARFFAEQGISPLVGERAGLLVPRQGGGRGHYDRFRHRLVFAVVDTLGRVVAFSARALDPPTADDLASSGPGAPTYDGEAPAKYINSPETPVYTKGEHLFGIYQARQGIRSRGEALLVEGNFDVVSLHARGIDNVVAPLGTAFTPEQAKLLKRFAPRVTVVFDADGAGRKATRAAREPCRAAGLEARVATLPQGKDPDELVRVSGPEALLEAVKGARGMLEYLVDDALSGEGIAQATLAERVARIREVAKLLASEDDPNLRAMAKLYADQLSRKLVVAGQAPTDLHQLERMLEGALREGANQRSDEARSRPGPQRAREPARSAEDVLGQHILGALLDFPELLRDQEVLEAASRLEGDLALSIVAVRRLLPPHPLEVEEFLATLPSSIQGFASGRLASPRFEEAAPAKTEVLDNASKIRGLHDARSKAATVEKLARGGMDEESIELLRALEERARRNKVRG